MTSGLTWAFLDSRLHVTGPAALCAELAALRGPCRPVPGPATGTVAVSANGDVLVDGLPSEDADPADPVGSVLTACNRLVLEQCASFASHAAVVAADGVAVVLPGVSGAGKSTLAAACAVVGLDVLSDEAAVLAKDGTLRPYPRPVSLAAWSLERLGLPAPAPGAHERAVSLASLGAARVEQPAGAVVAHVLVPERGHAGADRRPLSRGAAASTLLTRSFNHYRDPERALGVVAAVVRTAECATLTYGDPVEAAHVIRRLVAGRTGGPGIGV